MVTLRNGLNSNLQEMPEWRTNCPHAVMRLLAFFLTCCACAGQSIAVGVVGGGRFTDDVLTFPAPALNGLNVESAFRLESRFYDVGPTIEIGLTHGFAVEFDALYHRQGFFSTFYHDTVYYTSRERDKSWEFPLLLKYNLRFAPLHPFVEAGVAPRTISGSFAETSQVALSTPVGPPPPFGPSVPVSYSPSVGFVAGGGIQFSLGHLRLAPQVRYTRWGTAPVGGLFFSLGSTYSSNQNQVDASIGISWRVK
jgi:hypothetical protein